MWTRADLKERAKTALKPFYWYGVLACFIAGFLGGGTSGSGIGGSVSSSSRSNSKTYYGDSIFDEHFFAIFLTIMAVFLFIMVLALVLSIFVGNVVAVGKLRYFMESGTLGRSAGIERLFFGFSGGHYLNVVKIMFLRGLFETLWTLLLIIPGIYKHYEYYMVPYILADNPDIDSHEAFRLSKEMMDGNKLDTFVLELSFIGWYMLGVLFCCIGGIFVNPYYEMTFVELYWTLRDQIMGPQVWDEEQTVYTDTSYQTY